MKIVNEIIGWVGAVLILLAFGLVSFEVVKPIDLIYQILNALGALGIVYISFKKKVWQPGVLNFIWASIAIIAIVKLLVK
jgi:hypothetical protein